MAKQVRSIGSYGLETDPEFVVATVLSETYRPISIADLEEPIAVELQGHDPVEPNVKKFHQNPRGYITIGLIRLETEGYVMEKGLLYELTSVGERWLRSYFEDGYLLRGR